MGGSWDKIVNEGGGDNLQGISCPSNWLRLGIGPLREDDSNGKGNIRNIKKERGVSPSLFRMREEMIASRRESGNAIKRMRMNDEKEDVGSDYCWNN